jgi:single-strand DNA-binding protein
MSNLNMVAIQGTPGKDPEMKYTPAGKAITKFSVAVQGMGKDKTDWIDCVAWEKTAEFVQQYFSKGSQICINGRLQRETWETQDGGKRSKISVVVNHAHFCGKKADGGEAKPAQRRSEPQQDYGFGDDTVPF